MRSKKVNINNQIIRTILHTMEKPIESHIRQRKCCRLVLFPLPFQGHINPMIQLAQILYSKGFSITIIHSNFNSPNPSQYPHFCFRSFLDGFSESESSAGDIIGLLSVLNAKCAEPFRKCLTKLLSDVSEEPICCLITDILWDFVQPISESLNLPMLALRTSSVCSFLPLAALSVLLDKNYIPITDSQLNAPVLELPPLRVKDLPVVQKSDLEAYVRFVLGLVQRTRTSTGMIFNSLEALEEVAFNTLTKKFPIPIFPIGPFHKYFKASSSSLIKQDRSCISWLDTQLPSSVLYVSFGSLADLNEAEVLEIAWGLANSNQPFLWVVRRGLVCGSEWLEILPNGFLEMLGDRGKIVKWAPQLEVLAHPATGGFWTHNGWNSTLESICEGVPMICMPCFGDQLVNARYVSDVWRVGIHLERKLGRKEVARAITRLMVEEEGKEQRERILHLKDQLDICLKHGGSSYNSLESLITYILSFKPRIRQSPVFS